MKQLEVCPGTLAIGYTGYSPTAQKLLFDGKRVSPILYFNYNSESQDIAPFINQISMPGVQEKLSAIVEKGKIILTPAGAQGRYIIKPAPDYKHLRYRHFIPANEHLTMQIAKQVYQVPCAENGLIFFQNGEMAYITKRFDIAKDGTKIKQEDFSSLAQKTAITHGKDYKYSGNYEDIAQLIKQFVPAWQVEMTKLFKLMVFNYLFANGDAHLKIFSLQQTLNGDYLLSPAYDLLNTTIHVNDDDFALKEGLIPTNQHSEIYKNSGHPCLEDFITFANRNDVLPMKRDEIIILFTTEQPLVYKLIDQSFLDDKTKRIYKRSYQERLSRFSRRVLE